jgi:hypothetical protein
MPSSFVSMRSPSVQALERAQGFLNLPNGRILTGIAMTISAMFAAFEVAAGKVTGSHKKRRRRKGSLAFM